VADVLGRVRCPGRLEQLSTAPTVLLDAAMNADGVAALARALAEHFPGRRVHALVIASWRPREPLPILEPLCQPLPGKVIAVPLRPTVHDATDLVDTARMLGVASVRVTPTLEDAVATALEGVRTDDLVVITGSAHLIRPARALFAGGVW
jgi:dihydrofolate synthase/folylpolyglutamate synthase